jgi:DNA replication protein DnaC
MTTFDDSAEATADWRASTQAKVLALWQEIIPPVLAVPGDLHPDIAAWAARLAETGSAGNLLISGAVGAGKTWQALHAVEAAITGGWTGSAEFVTTTGWRSAVGPPQDQDALRKLRERGVIILDDPGAVRIGDWDLEHLYAIADYRWSHALPVIITTNVTDMRAMLGERIASRLADKVTVVKITGADRRRNPS